MLRFCAALLACFLWVYGIAAQSQPPTLSSTNAPSQQEQQSQSKAQDADSRKDSGSPPVAPSSLGQPQASSPDTKSDPPGDWWLLSLSDTIMALLTAAIGLIAFIQVRRMGETNEHMRAVERAYVTMSHHPPGILPVAERLDGDLPRWKHRLTLRMKVQNHGNTPAKITRALVQVIMTTAPFPPNPSYTETEGRDGHVSLVKDDSYSITIPYEFSGTGEKAWDLCGSLGVLHNQGHRLYVIGYVDYIDKFDHRHRAGYGRVYEPAIDDRKSPAYQRPNSGNDGGGGGLGATVKSYGTHYDGALYDARNNMVLLTMPGYNYDRPRAKGEGTDWEHEQ